MKTVKVGQFKPNASPVFCHDSLGMGVIRKEQLIFKSGRKSKEGIYTSAGSTI
jgi:hypothetical protein